MKKKKLLILFILMIFPAMVNADTSYSADANGFFNSAINKIGDTFNIDFYSVIGIGAVIVIILSIVLASFFIKKFLYNPSNGQNLFSKNVSNRKIKALDPSLNPDEFRKFVSETFKTTADAFSNFKYDVLKDNFSDKLYNDKLLELESFKNRKIRNIISNINPLYCQINKIQVINNIETVEVIFTAQFKDYIVAETDSDVIMSGSKRDTQERTYLLAFIKTELNSVCPKCGGEVQNDKCIYCRFNHNEKQAKWILDKMKILKQKTIGK